MIVAGIARAPTCLHVPCAMLTSFLIKVKYSRIPLGDLNIHHLRIVILSDIFYLLNRGRCPECSWHESWTPVRYFIDLTWRLFATLFLCWNFPSLVNVCSPRPLSFWGQGIWSNYPGFTSSYRNSDSVLDSLLLHFGLYSLEVLSA